MVTTQVTARISLPVASVFNHIVNFENMVEYNSSVQSSTLVQEGTSKFPSFKIKVDMGIKKIEGIYTIQEIIPNQKIVASCETSDLSFEDTYIFREENNKTYFEITDRTKLKGLLALSEILLGPIMKMQMNSNLDTLVKILERPNS